MLKHKQKKAKKHLVKKLREKMLGSRAEHQHCFTFNTKSGTPAHIYTCHITHMNWLFPFVRLKCGFTALSRYRSDSQLKPTHNHE